MPRQQLIVLWAGSRADYEYSPDKDDRNQEKKMKRRYNCKRGVITLLILLVLFGCGSSEEEHSDSVKRQISGQDTQITSEAEQSREETGQIRQQEGKTAEQNTRQPENETEEQPGSETTKQATEQPETERILATAPGEQAAEGILTETDPYFYETGITDDLLQRINGISYTQNENIKLTQLRYLRMLYCGMDGNTYVGEMIVNEEIAQTVLTIFQKLYQNQYPIERMVLVDDYGGDDEASMEADNTSAFNYRKISGSEKLSNHSYGYAIDLNPRYNPCVRKRQDGTWSCEPQNGTDSMERSATGHYQINSSDLAYQLFTQAGFSWGGNWNSLKDYQHFEYVVQ